jgi:hypothetical protein
MLMPDGRRSPLAGTRVESVGSTTRPIAPGRCGRPKAAQIYRNRQSASGPAVARAYEVGEHPSVCGAVRPPGASPPARFGMPPDGVLAVVCLDNPRDNPRGKARWTSLPSLGPQEECRWRLSDVIPARMVSHTLYSSSMEGSDLASIAQERPGRAPQILEPVLGVVLILT